MVKPILRSTADGSNTLYVEDIDQCYHSTHGALQESQHIFIDNGLEYILQKKQNPSILEIGLGTGLNCLLTFNTVHEVDYTAIEKFPISVEQAVELKYHSNKEELDNLKQIHSSKWEKQLNVRNHRLYKIQNDIINYDFGTDKYDLVYFDAFSPEAQPNLWTEAVFIKMYRAMNQGGILITYCAKGVVKRTLKSIGFALEHPPGPPGKREITRAIK